MTKFLPIINYDIQDGILDDKAIEILYRKSCKILSTNFKEVEISTSSYKFWDNLETILEATKHPAFGSITSTEIANKLITKLDSNQSYKFFAPAYDEQVAELLSEYSNIEYIPGIFSAQEYLEVAKYDSVKIFPFECKNSRDMLEILKAPYPEFREAKYYSRVIFDIKEISDAKIYIVSSPRDYQKIRTKFLEDSQSKIFIQLNHKNCDLLASSIPKPKYISRITIEQCRYPNSIVSTRVFGDLVNDLVSGLIDIERLEDYMLDNLCTKVS